MGDRDNGTRDGNLRRGLICLIGSDNPPRQELDERLAAAHGLNTIKTTRSFFDHVEVWPDVLLLELRMRRHRVRHHRSLQPRTRTCFSVSKDSRTLRSESAGKQERDVLRRHDAPARVSTNPLCEVPAPPADAPPFCSHRCERDPS
ncbi:hypothetical protein [Gryllotalpicola protaetiae]|uniref:hypothetical protein n=1 Tax=Gryllotalpicola protaetiae TaxID=2419771 RepID=UPI0013C40C82|nr:hypothetical protein [Gryllotalpicola protaetiae]